MTKETWFSYPGGFVLLIKAMQMYSSYFMWK